MAVKHETCQQYFKRRISEGWECISLEGHKAILLSPWGFRRELDLRGDVETLRPNAPGDLTQVNAQEPSSGSHYEKVDEAEADEDSTYVANWQNTNYETDLYNLDNHQSASGTINKITVHARCMRGPGYSYLKTAIKSGSTTDYGDEETLTTDWANYSHEWTTNPDDSEAFEESDLDSFQAGVSLKSSSDGGAECTQVYVEVDYTAGVNVTVEVPVADTTNAAGNAPTLSIGINLLPPVTTTVDIQGYMPTISTGWLSGWAKRIKLTLDHDDIDAALTWFPIYVHVSASSGHSSKDISCVFDELTSDDNRKKIAVTKSDGTTELYVEIEKWDDANEQAHLWVSRDGWEIADDADTELYLYFDSGHADNDSYVGDTNSEVAENVWDANHKVVYHMADGADTSHIYDSTSNDNDGAKTGAANPAVTTSGQIADAQEYNGDEYIDVGINSYDLGIRQNATYSAWVKPSALSGYQRIISDWGDSKGMTFGLADGDDLEMYVYPNNHRIIKTNIITTDWQLISAVLDGSDILIYRNGVYLDKVSLGEDIGDSAETLKIGIRGDLQEYYFTGFIDEVSISDADRSVAWLKATYETGRDNLLDFGSEEAAAGQSVEIAIPLCDATIAGYVPTFIIGINLLPPVSDTADVAGCAPTLSIGINLLPAAATTVDAQGYAPTILVTTDISVPLADTVDLAGNAPVLSIGINLLPPVAGTIDATALAPQVQISKEIAIPLADTISALGYAPVLSIGINLLPPVADTVDLAGYAPTLSININLAIPTTDTVTITGYAPTLSIGVNISIPVADTVDLAGYVVRIITEWILLTLYPILYADALRSRSFTITCPPTSYTDTLRSRSFTITCPPTSYSDTLRSENR